MPRGKLGFPKDSRLLRRPEFLVVKASGQGFAEAPAHDHGVGQVVPDLHDPQSAAH